MPDFKLTSGLPSYPSGLDDKDANLLLPLYRAVNNLAAQVAMLTGQVQFSQEEFSRLSGFTLTTAHNQHKMHIQAAEQLDYGIAVNLFIDAGVIKGRKAQANAPIRPCYGVVDVPGGIPANGWGEIVFMQGRVRGIGGTAFGSTYWLSTGGLLQATPPGGGFLNQAIGIGLGSEGFWLNISNP